MRRMPLDNDDEPGPVTDNEISSFFASLDLSYSDVTELATRWFFRQRTVNLSAPLSDDGSADTEASVRVRLCAQRVQEPTPTGVTPPRRPCSHDLGPARQLDSCHRSGLCRTCVLTFISSGRGVQ